jgi:acyl-coenzyme A synthetase/AMP-(fatty) acid ligase
MGFECWPHVDFDQFNHRRRIWMWDSLPRTETRKPVRREIVRTLSEVAD